MQNDALVVALALASAKQQDAVIKAKNHVRAATTR